MQRLRDKTALVTGAGRGIGAAIAQTFAAEGANVWITDLDVRSGQATQARLGSSTAFRRLDVREEADWQTVMAELLTTEGKLDILVNSAGITGLDDGAAHDPEHATLTDWQAVQRTNVEGVFLGCKHALRAMRPTGTGSIVNITSRSGVVGVPRAAAYAASKAAVINHTRSVALYCAEEQLAVRCNALVPGAVLTPMWDAMVGSGPERAAALDAIVADVPLRRFGRPDEVAAVALLLASDEATYVTGAEIAIDGGLLAGTTASVKPASS